MSGICHAERRATPAAEASSESQSIDIFLILCYNIRMPKITDMQIQKKNKTRANVYIDGEFAFALEMLTVMKLGLKIGSEISSERLTEAITDSERSVCFDKAMNYLSRGMKTCKQMREYLLGKGYAYEVVNYVMDKLMDYKYLNDEYYAKVYVEQNQVSKGERRLKQELQLKGVPRAIVEQYCVVESDTATDNAERLAAKYMRNKPHDLKTLQKLQRYLLSRGYDFDVVNSIIRSYKLDAND